MYGIGIKIEANVILVATFDWLHWIATIQIKIKWSERVFSEVFFLCLLLRSACFEHDYNGIRIERTRGVESPHLCTLHYNGSMQLTNFHMAVV